MHKAKEIADSLFAIQLFDGESAIHAAITAVELFFSTARSGNKGVIETAETELARKLASIVKEGKTR